MLMWALQPINLVPYCPHLFAQSKTARSLSFICGAPSIVNLPKIKSLASVICSWVYPKWSSKSKFQSFKNSFLTLSLSTQKSEPTIDGVISKFKDVKLLI